MKERREVVGSFERRLIHIEEEDKAKERLIQKIDDLIWRRKIQEKPYDQLEEIREEVEKL